MSDSFSKKLYNYAPPPPENIWEGIEKALNEPPLFAQKLHSYQTQPPATTWNKIAALLQNSLQESKVVPIHRSHNWLRYAAAAALIIFIAGGSYFLSVEKSIAPTSAATQKVATLKQHNVVAKTKTKGLSNLDTGSPSNHPAVPVLAAANLASFSKLSKTNFTRTAINASEQQVHVTNAFIPVYAEREKRFGVNENAEKYMVYSDGDGNAMRLSRRLFDIVACIKPEIKCKERIAILQQKMAATTLATDFTGLVAMLSDLKEN